MWVFHSRFHPHMDPLPGNICILHAHHVPDTSVQTVRDAVVATINNLMGCLLQTSIPYNVECHTEGAKCHVHSWPMCHTHRAAVLVTNRTHSHRFPSAMPAILYAAPTVSSSTKSLPCGEGSSCTMLFVYSHLAAVQGAPPNGGGSHICGPHRCGQEAVCTKFARTFFDCLCPLRQVFPLMVSSQFVTAPWVTPSSGHPPHTSTLLHHRVGPMVHIYATQHQMRHNAVRRRP